EQGAGPVALFVHGVLLNGHLWRQQLSQLSDTRRCIAVDLLAHGETEIAPGQDVSVTANALMLESFLDALSIDQVDLVGNDSGGWIAQIFAGAHPERLRSLTPTDCDAQGHSPPAAFKAFLARAPTLASSPSSRRGGWPARSRPRAGGSSGTAPASAVPKSAPRSSTGHCARIGGSECSRSSAGQPARGVFRAFTASGLRNVSAEP